ncbi:MAG: hypothetical protein RLZZ301_240 [Bacteroidota bacterium]|jgi:hypothetical protein
MKVSVLIALIWSAFATAQNVLVSEGNFFEGEPHLAINPTNPQQLVAAWMGYQPNQKIVIKTAVSTDAGQTWSSPQWFTHLQTGNSSADVSMAFDATGVLYLAHIDYDNVGFSNGQIVCRKSLDGGSTWNAPVTVRSISSCPNQLCIDRPWIAVDPLTGTVVVTSMNAEQPSLVQPPYHPYIAVSSDQGASFSVQQLDVAPYLAGSTIQQPMPSPAFANDGVFVAVYPSYLTSQSVFPRLIEVRKTPISSSYSYSTAFQGLGFGTSNDSLKSAPHLALNPQNSGIAAYTFLSEVFGDPDVVLIEKENGTWSAPQRVNADTQGNGVLQDLAWAAYDTDGDLAVCWRDRRNGAITTFESPTQIYCRIKSNGQWGTEWSISPQVAHDSILLQNGNDMLNIQFQNNQLYTIWGDVRSGSLKIYINRYNQTDSSNTVQEIASETSLYPNPSTGWVFLKNGGAHEEIRLYNEAHQLLVKGTLDDLHGVDLNPYPNGIYFIEVGAEAFIVLKN